MTTYYRAAIECDAQRSVKCEGVMTVPAADPKALPDRSWDAVTAKGWRRIRVSRDAAVQAWQTHDICPACQVGLAEAEAEQGQEQRRASASA